MASLPALAPGPQEFWVTLPARTQRLGRPVVVRMRDLTAGEFAREIPDVVIEPSTACYAGLDAERRARLRVQWEQWVDAMIACAVVEPEWLTAERVARLGADRELLGQALLQRWGIYQEVPYKRNFLLMLRKLALKTRRLPSELLRLPAGEFWFCYTVMFMEDIDGDLAEDVTAPHAG